MYRPTPFVDRTQLVQNNQLRPEQADSRNIANLRFFELSDTFLEFDQPVESEAYTRTIDLTQILKDFTVLGDKMFRLFTINLDSFSIRHQFEEVGPPPVAGFSEAFRESIFVSIPFLELETRSRYSAMLSNDFNTMSNMIPYTVKNLPTIFQIRVGILNNDADDYRMYNFNANRQPPNTSFQPQYVSQYIRSINIRFSIRVSIDNNFIPVIGNNICPSVNEGLRVDGNQSVNQILNAAKDGGSSSNALSLFSSTVARTQALVDLGEAVLNTMGGEGILLGGAGALSGAAKGKSEAAKGKSGAAKGKSEAAKGKSEAAKGKSGAAKGTRGRPPGTKNRSQKEIDAERFEKALKSPSTRGRPRLTTTVRLVSPCEDLAEMDDDEDPSAGPAVKFKDK